MLTTRLLDTVQLVVPVSRVMPDPTGRDTTLESTRMLRPPDTPMPPWCSHPKLQCCTEWDVAAGGSGLEAPRLRNDSAWPWPDAKSRPWAPMRWNATPWKYAPPS
jgi:hypothetical protein